MPSRSSRSSLLEPPTTVAEDDDSTLNGIRDEKRSDWQLRRFANDDVIEELDRMALSPPVERVIKGFNEELDTLTKYMESLFQKDRSYVETTSSIATPHLPSVSTIRRNTPSREKDPPPTVSPSRNYNHSTPMTRSGLASYTPSEPPPEPIATPGFGVPTPNRHRTRRTTAPPRVNESYASSQHDRFSTSHRDNNDAKLEELYNIVREQESRIQDLEIENEVLRKKLKLLPPQAERVHRASSIAVAKERDVESKKDADPEPSTDFHHRFDSVVEPPEIRRNKSDRSTLQEDPEGRQHHVGDSPYRTQSSFLSTPSRRVLDRPPRQIQTLSDTIQLKDFTPGTRLVYDLAILMKIEKSNCVPLSMLLDKHWDLLKQHFQEDNREHYQR